MKYLIDTLQLTSFLSLTMGYHFFNFKIKSNLKNYFLFLTFVFLLDLGLEQITSYSNGLYVKIVYIIIRPIEIWFLFKIIGDRNQTIQKKYFYVSNFLLIIFCIYKLVFKIQESSSATDVLILYFLIGLVLILFYFKNILSNDLELPLGQRPEFFISLGLFFFILGNIISTGFYHKIYKISPQIAFSLYKTNYLLGILKNVLFGYAFYLVQRIKISYE